MFQKTRIKLTIWYLVIIMAISIFFSAFIYFGANQEFNRVLRMQEYRNENPDLRLRIIQGNSIGQVEPNLLVNPDPEVIEEARLRVLESLFGINVLILMLSGLAGYFLAGRTLKPIKNMIDEQNRFITDASHELNTPLTSIKTSIEVNLRNKKLNLFNAKKILTSNLEDVNSLQTLSDELITLTQYQNLNGSFISRKINITDVIKNSVEKIQPMADQKQIKISLSLQKSFVNADQRSLGELFTILLDNAVKYSKNKTAVAITVKKIDNKVETKISDQGMGIPKEDLPFIFDRFYRSDKSRTKQNTVGYGLGLSIAKRIAILHDGIIDVKSEIGKGSVFTIILNQS